MFLNCVRQLQWSLGRRFPELYLSCLTITTIISVSIYTWHTPNHGFYCTLNLWPHTRACSASSSTSHHQQHGRFDHNRCPPPPSSSKTSFSAWRHKRSNSTRPVALAVPAHWRVNGCWFCSARRHVVAVLPARGRCESLVMDGELWGGGGGGSAEGKHLHANNRICLLATHTDCINVQSRAHR